MDNKKRIINAIALYVLALVVFVATVIFLYMNKTKMNNVEIAIVVVIVIVIFGGAFIFLVQRLTKTGHYMCTKCEHKFVPSTKKYLITLKIGGSCYLECPACKKKSWCKKNIIKINPAEMKYSIICRIFLHRGESEVRVDRI